MTIPPDIERGNVTKTVDDLGLQTSIDYAKAQQVISETKKYIEPTRYGRPPTERESVQTTPTKSDVLLGVVAQGRYAIFPPPADPKARITALSEGRLATSIGEGDALQEKINKAPGELKEDNAKFKVVSSFAEEYRSTDKDCEHIHGRLGQYNKG